MNGPDSMGARLSMLFPFLPEMPPEARSDCKSISSCSSELTFQGATLDLTFRDWRTPLGHEGPKSEWIPLQCVSLATPNDRPTLRCPQVSNPEASKIEVQRQKMRRL